MPPVETVPLPSTSISIPQVDGVPRKRVKITPTWQDETHLRFHESRVQYYAEFDSSSELSWIPRPKSSGVVSSSYQSEASATRGRHRRAERCARSNTLGSPAYPEYGLEIIEGYNIKNIISFVIGGSVIFMGSGTLLLQVLQLTPQAGQTF